MTSELPPTSVSQDLVRSLCGEKLGEGMSREVYVWTPNDKLVLKLETGVGYGSTCGHFQNVCEWLTWRALAETKYSGWLAPVVWISESGNALLMHRTKPMREGEEPKSIPMWLNDHKRKNFGLLLGKVVCHDYGTNSLINHGAFGAKKRKPKWY